MSRCGVFLFEIWDTYAKEAFWIRNVLPCEIEVWPGEGSVKRSRGDLLAPLHWYAQTN